MDDSRKIDSGKRSQVSLDIIELMLEEQTSMKDVYASKLIAESKARTLGALKNKSSREFRSYLETSDSFLRSHLGSKVQMTILYVDLVGSTHMSMILSLERMTTIIQTFVQEMTIVVANNYGYVLKYMGDAIIAYFPIITNETDFHTSYKRALLCAIDMLITVGHGVNTIFKEFDLPELHIKIGIDSGVNAIIEYGSSSSKAKSHIDVIGYPMNLTAKITAMAMPDHVMVGNTTYQGLDLLLRKMLTKLGLKRLDYIDYQTGDTYMVFSFSLDF